MIVNYLFRMPFGRKRNFIIAIVIVLFGVLACSQSGTKTDTAGTPEAIHKDISVSEAYEMLHQDERPSDLVLLDVRTPAEYEQGHLEESVLINIGDPSFREKINELDRNKTYVVYCRSGRRSNRAAGIMEEMGFNEVYNVQGGLLAWKAANYPTEK